MPPKKTDQQQPAAPPVAVVATAMTMVQGFAVQIVGFVPVPRDDLRKQAEIPMLLLDIQEGRKPLADIIGHMQMIETRQQHVGKRVPKADADRWAAQKALPLDKKDGDEKTDTDPPDGDEHG